MDFAVAMLCLTFRKGFLKISPGGLSHSGAGTCQGLTQDSF